MKQKAYEHLHEQRWSKVDQSLAQPRQWWQRKALPSDAAFVRALPNEYRQLCHDYAISQARNYSPQLVERLNTIVMKLHHALYRQRPRFRHQGFRFIAFDFPDALKANSQFIWASLFLFFFLALLWV